MIFVTIFVARAVSPNPAFALAAATQSALVMILPAPVGGPFSRSLDGLVAGVVALLLTALIPRDTRRIATRDGRALASTLSQSMTSLVEGLMDSNQPAANLAFERLRKTQVLIDNWTTSLDSATRRRAGSRPSCGGSCPTCGGSRRCFSGSTSPPGTCG